MATNASRSQQQIWKELSIKNPKLVETIKRVEEILKEVSAEMGIELEEKGRYIIIADDMTPEEEEMAWLECFLKEGMSLEEAEQKTKKILKIMKEME